MKIGEKNVGMIDLWSGLSWDYSFISVRGEHGCNSVVVSCYTNWAHPAHNRNYRNMSAIFDDRHEYAGKESL